MEPSKSAIEEVSFERSQHKISSTEAQKLELHIFIIDSGNERAKKHLIKTCICQQNS